MKCLRVCTFAQTYSAASLSSTPLSTPKPEVATWKPPAQGQQPGVLSPATRSPGGAASSIAASGRRHRQCVQEEAQEKTSVASRRGTCGNCQWNRTRASGRKQAETTQLLAKILWITQSPRYENFGEASFPLITRPRLLITKPRSLGQEGGLHTFPSPRSPLPTLD